MISCACASPPIGEKRWVNTWHGVSRITGGGVANVSSSFGGMGASRTLLGGNVDERVKMGWVDGGRGKKGKGRKIDWVMRKNRKGKE